MKPSKPSTSLGTPTLLSKSFWQAPTIQELAAVNAYEPPPKSSPESPALFRSALRNVPAFLEHVRSNPDSYRPQLVQLLRRATELPKNPTEFEARLLNEAAIDYHRAQAPIPKKETPPSVQKEASHADPEAEFYAAEFEEKPFSWL